MTRRRSSHSADEHDHYGDTHRHAPQDFGPLFGGATPAVPAPPHKLPPAPKRYTPLPPSYDTLIGRHADAPAPAAAPVVPATRPRAPDRVLDAAPHAPGSATSARAAASVSRAFRPQAYRIAAFIASRAATGATREQIADTLHLRLSSVCAAVHALWKRGMIGSNAGHTREGSSGLQVEVLLHERYVRRWTDGQTRPAAYLADMPEGW